MNSVGPNLTSTFDWSKFGPRFRLLLGKFGRLCHYWSCPYNVRLIQGRQAKYNKNKTQMQ